MNNSLRSRAQHREESIRAKTLGSLNRYDRARKSLAGGVSSGLRRTARPHPLYFSHGQGARIIDVDGNPYLDYGLAWGPLILGHAPLEVTFAVAAQAGRELTFGAQHDLEIEIAEKLTRIIPCAELVCFANSGTEIVQVALRLARAYTGRAKFLKFEGHYHGWDDSVLVSYHPSEAQLKEANGKPVGVGAGQRAHSDVVIAEWNDRNAVEKIFAESGTEISAVICEPMLCNSGCIAPEHGFLAFLREITQRYKALLIFDEVITGFRLRLGGAQDFYGITPDLATYAKAIGGGLPLSALAGRRKFMGLIADGMVIHGGTLNGNPIVLTAAKATLDVLEKDHGAVFADIARRGWRLRSGVEGLLRKHGYNVVTAGDGAVFHLAFLDHNPKNYRELMAADTKTYGDFAVALLDEGVMVLPDGRWYCSVAHTDDVIGATLDAVERALQ